MDAQVTVMVRVVYTANGRCLTRHCAVVPMCVMFPSHVILHAYIGVM